MNKEWFYIGLSKDPEKRLIKHNLGRTASTKPYRPFELIYKKKLDNIEQARDYEKFLKVHSNKEKFLRQLGY